MDASILNSTKKKLGLESNYTPFDEDILNYINSAFSSLEQIGIGPIGGFFIDDETAEWSDLGLPEKQLSMVKVYVSLKAQMLFDPPSTSFVIEAKQNQIREYEWRLTTFHEETIP